MTVVVSHNGCEHEADSWTHALSMALNHAGKTMNVPSRDMAVRLMRTGNSVTHQDETFTGETVR